MNAGTLYMFCGKMASGKSTLAKEIARQKSLVLIVEDTLLGTLYPGEITSPKSYEQCSSKLKSAMRPIIVNLLQNGTSIVLDFPANTIAQRKWMMGIVVESGAHQEFHYLDCSNEVCKSRLSERAIKEPERRLTDTPEMFDAISQYFEPPTSDEGFELLMHRSV